MFVFWFASSNLGLVSAQEATCTNGNLTGKVSGYSQQSVKNATVQTVGPASRIAKTDSHGRFEIKDLLPVTMTSCFPRRDLLEARCSRYRLRVANVGLILSFKPQPPPLIER